MLSQKKEGKPTVVSPEGKSLKNPATLMEVIS
jgi:hypothetical protein